MPGFLATKHANVFSRYRGSVGFSFGAGVGPRLEANYRERFLDGPSTTLEKTYRPDRFPVTPLFQVLLRGDIRVARALSIGPFFGLRNGFLAGGGTLRVHFLR